MTDTSPQIRAILCARLARMAPSEKVRIAADLWARGHALQCASVRQQFPGADEDEVIFRVAALRFGEELARRAYRR